jgi:hypothetical protein
VAPRAIFLRQTKKRVASYYINRLSGVKFSKRTLWILSLTANFRLNGRFLIGEHRATLPMAEFPVAKCSRCGAETSLYVDDLPFCLACDDRAKEDDDLIESDPGAMSRPLPGPPRCRGIPIGDANYANCAYGYGDLPPFVGPCDCPVCQGSEIKGDLDDAD